MEEKELQNYKIYKITKKKNYGGQRITNAVSI